MSLLPPSWTNTVSLFRLQESLTRPVNRHTSLVRSLPDAMSSSLSPRDSHSHAYTHTKAQTNPSEIFNHATHLALPLLSFVILYLLVCLPACSFGSCCLSFLPFLLFICSVISTEPSSAPGQNVLGTSLPDYFTFSCFLFTWKNKRMSVFMLDCYLSFYIPYLGVVWFCFFSPFSHFQSFQPHYNYLRQCIC